MRVLAFALLAALAAPVQAVMQAKPAEWELDGTKFSGFVVYDDSGANKPGIVMVPNWMGVTEAAVERARAIAGSDYVVLVADVYGRDVRPKNPQEAGQAAHAAYADLAGLRARAGKAVEVLKANTAGAPLDASRVAAVGFCFGGSTVLELARSGAELAGVVTFHGGLDTAQPAQAGAVKASLLVLNGAADGNVPPEQVQAFQKEMDAAGADWQFVNFSGAVHCFAEPDANRPPGCKYDEKAAKRAYSMMRGFLAERFGS
jgi:dienelactone hydrolase